MQYQSWSCFVSLVLYKIIFLKVFNVVEVD